MLDNALLDVIIGLIFLFLILSLFVTALNESINALLALRAKTLSAALDDLLTDDSMRESFYGMPAIRLLYRASTGHDPKRDAPGRPALIRKFRGPSYIADQTFARTITSMLVGEGRADDAGGLRGSLEKMPETPLKSLLLELHDDSRDDMDTFRQRIADWYDDAMDRASGRFKRYMVSFSLAFGFFVSAALNADTIRIAETLWSDASLRTQIAASAGEIILDPNNVEEFSSAAKLEQALRPIPLGWDFADASVAVAGHAGLTQIFYKAVGLTLTALAISLGAPFWFDVLKRFVNLKSSGPKPAGR